MGIAKRNGGFVAWRSKEVELGEVRSWGWEK